MAAEGRGSWATFLAQQISRSGWSVARLARESGIHRSTIFRWLKGDGGITVHSVRAVAEALGVPLQQALAAAGNLVHETPPAPVMPSELQHILGEVQHILAALADPDIPDDEKRALRIVLQMAAARARAARREPSQESYPNG